MSDPGVARGLISQSNKIDVGLLAFAFAWTMLVGAEAQSLTTDPSTWRPISYADLQHPTAAVLTYADLWKDALERNNRAYVERGDHRFTTGNAPATEAHFVIWSSRKSVVFSELNTATTCTLKELRTSVRASIKMCPMRVAVYQGAAVQTLDAGLGCYLELAPAASDDPQAPGRAEAYAAYELRTRTLSIGIVIDHQAVEGCSRRIPLPAG